MCTIPPFDSRRTGRRSLRSCRARSLPCPSGPLRIPWYSKGRGTRSLCSLHVFEAGLVDFTCARTSNQLRSTIGTEISPVGLRFLLLRVLRWAVFGAGGAGDTCVPVTPLAPVAPSRPCAPVEPCAPRSPVAPRSPSVLSVQSLSPRPERRSHLQASFPARTFGPRRSSAPGVRSLPARLRGPRRLRPLGARRSLHTLCPGGTRRSLRAGGTPHSFRAGGADHFLGTSGA